MPTYEYECRHCKHRFEEFQSINDRPLVRCPKCGKGVRRLFGGGLGIIFKGSGFYTTDYKRSSTVGGNGSGRSKDSSAESKAGESKAGEKKTGDSSSDSSSSSEKKTTSKAT
jgi:putative FmdB family regulatory protein